MSKRLKIASWNINSVRARAALVERLIVEEQPDILCLQETKVVDDIFPAELFIVTAIATGSSTASECTTALRSSVGCRLQDPGKHDWQDNGEARHIGVRLECGIRLENVYVPAGGDTPDRTVNPKFGQKLDFIERMTRWSESLNEPTIIVGDFNVAPLECDVWSHKALLTVVSHTPVEVEALNRLQQTHDWIDIGRRFIPAPERCFTWWSYRSPDWTKNDRGRRLDHMWCSPELGGHLVAHQVLEPCRNWERPSDHVPLICEMEI